MGSLAIVCALIALMEVTYMAHTPAGNLDQEILIVSLTLAIACGLTAAIKEWISP